MEQYNDDYTHFDHRAAGDASVHARFYIVAEKDEAASAKEGRPIFVDREHVEIVAAGNANNIVRRRASDMDRQRFHRQYARFKQGEKEQEVGTPLKEVAWLTRSQVDELAYFHVRTLEALANLADDICGKHVGLFDLKRKAQAFIKQSEEGSGLTDALEQIKARDDQIAALTQSVKEMAEELKKLKGGK